MRTGLRDSRLSQKDEEELEAKHKKRSKEYVRYLQMMEFPIDINEIALMAIQVGINEFLKGVRYENSERN